MTVVLALDAGTTGVRTLAIDEAGSVVASAYREITQHYPQSGWVEHDPTEIVTAQLATMAEVCSQLDERPAAIGITNQRETVIAWDRRSGQPHGRAIVWQDRRTAPRCETLAADGHLDEVRATTGLVLDPYFSGTKAAWMLTDGGVPTGGDLAIGTVDAWLLWNLTGGEVFATEGSNASRTMLFDIRSGTWSEPMADLLGVPISALPEVRPTSGRFGETAAGLDGIPAGVPISGIAGDQQSALFGQACFEPGTAKNTYGTGSFLLANVGPTCPEPTDGVLTTVAWTIDGETTYALEGAVFVTGAAVQWLRDGLGIISSAAEIGELAATVDDSGDVFFVPALAGLASPWWDPYARGTIVGISRATTAAHLARATLDGIAHQVRDVIDAMVAATGTEISSLRVDGGASASDLLMQIQADLVGCEVVRPTNQETTAMGAAYLAGLAEGVWSSPDAVAERWTVDRTFEPTRSAGAAQAAHDRWHRAVERSRSWAR